MFKIDVSLSQLDVRIPYLIWSYLKSVVIASTYVELVLLRVNVNPDFFLGVLLQFEPHVLVYDCGSCLCRKCHTSTCNLLSVLL